MNPHDASPRTRPAHEPVRQAARSAALAAVAAFAATLASCAPDRPVGDASGGIIDWFASTKAQVAEAASAHCARYGRTARVTNTERDKSGGHAVFVCE